MKIQINRKLVALVTAVLLTGCASVPM
jgi:starvation-inducible outer membrane lipoprotein